MNNHEYHKAIRMHENYLKIKEQFENNSGIIQPIRAVVIDMNKCVVRESAQAHYCLYGSKIAEIINACRVIDCGDFTDSAIEEFLKQSKVVGYIAAIKGEDGSIQYGLSYCNDADYSQFNKEFGSMLAMKRALNRVVDLDSCNTDMEFVNFTKGSTHTYVWPITYGEQIDHFVKRARKYFK